MNGARYAYLSRLCELVAEGKDIVFVSNDYAAPVFDRFRLEYPERFISVGIAEQNQIAVSCGLALTGKRVIAYGCAPFPITRAYDQIRSAVAMMHTPINIAMAGIGFAIPEWGATHYNAEDVALMRTIPNMRIITPTDNVMGVAAADYALENQEPTYLRFDKYAEGMIYEEKTIDFMRGFEVLRNGSDVAVISCGSFVHRILQLAEAWQKSGINAKVIDLYSLPVDANALMSAIGDMPVLIVEEHIISGGIGSMVLEMLYNNELANPIRRLGIDFAGKYPQTSGSREYYINLYGLSDHDISQSVAKLTERIGV